MKRILTLVLLSMLLMPAYSQIKWKKDKKDWFVGGQLAANYAVADNITDHPPFKYFGNALGLGFNVYAGKFFTPKIGARLSLGYADVRNRGDHEYVNAKNMRVWSNPQYQDFSDYFGHHGYYHFGAFNVYGDALFDFTAMSTSKEHAFHVLGLAGLGLSMTGEKSLYPTSIANQEDIDRALKVLAKDKDGGTFFTFRLGFILDYRVSSNVSLNFEGDLNIYGDKFDGIDYDEPLDFLLIGSLGLTYYF
ncbi:MAG: hypothetical protein IJP82_09120 [Bacteroidaceae bacterium]|nr:hypothetical protein [Bacteroidaceae bacterium]